MRTNHVLLKADILTCYEQWSLTHKMLGETTMLSLILKWSIGHFSYAEALEPSIR